MRKVRVQIMLSPEDVALADALAQKLGTSRSAAIRIAIRRVCRPLVSPPGDPSR